MKLILDRKTIFWSIGILIVILLGGGLVGLSLPQRMVCLMVLVLIAAAILFSRGIKSRDKMTILIYSILSLTMVVCVYFYFRQSLYF
jgi:hypothetical protein